MHTPATLRTILAKRRWSTADARLVRDAVARSGGSPSAFAARHGLHPVRLQRLCARTPPVRFAEVTLARVPAIETAALRIDVAPTVLALHVLDPDRCPPDWLARLARALGATAS